MLGTLNAWFNGFIEMSHLLLGRLLELPVVYVTGVLLLGVTLVYLAWRLVRRWRSRPQLSWRSYFVAMAVVFVLGVVFLLDRKLAYLQEDIGELTYFVRAKSVADSRPATPPPGNTPVPKSADQSSQPGAQRSAKPSPQGTALPHRLIQPAELEKGLKSIFSQHDSDLTVVNRAIEFVSIRSRGRDPAACFVAVVDLTDAAISIVITEKITRKRLTSAFARDNGCAIAINGEAGSSPFRTARLGRYTGICISRGKTVLSENPYNRPMLSFDRKNRARYFSRRTEVKELSDDMYNVIWGRDDLLKDGKYVPEDSRRWSRRNPRTLMGIDAEGTRLILMIVDGRQRGYSEGLDLKDCTALMRLFGAHNAMRCDQGGSSAMYLDTISKIVSRPSDGRERPTYTHFGVGFEK